MNKKNYSYKQNFLFFAFLEKKMRKRKINRDVVIPFLKDVLPNKL